MTLLTRISRLFTADIHGLLDSLEEPDIILKQAIRDMQAEIDRETAAISVLTQQLDRLQQKRQTLVTHLQELQHQLHFCFSENNEYLAKSVVRKKLQTESALKELSRQLNTLCEEKNQKIAETDERKEKLQAIRDKLMLLDGADEAASLNEQPTAISQDDIELAFLYEKQRYNETSVNGEKS